MPPKEKKQKVAEEEVDNDAILKQYLKTHEEDHYNNNKEDYDYRVSTGSLKLDKETGGGLSAGIHRLCGPYESGKSSESFEILANFLDTVENSRGLYVKAEGRLSKTMMKRVGRSFVTEIEDWKPGTILILKSNIYETIANFIYLLVHKNESNFRYCVVIDSMDGMNLKADMIKAENNANKKPEASQEQEKVAGAPLLTKLFLKKMSLPIGELGHMILMISQVSADIKIDKYSKGSGRKLSGTGGNAALHFANWIFDFLSPSRADFICKSSDDAVKIDADKNPILGHWVRVIIRKSDNEKTGYTFAYPVKRNVYGKSSIWRSMEVVDKMLEWELISKKGAWFTFHETAIERSKKAGSELPVKVQGLHAVYDMFDKDTELADLWYKYFLDNDVAESVTDNIGPELFDEDED
jgi:RecA/RadA recombinase